MPAQVFSISRRNSSNGNVEILAPKGAISFSSAPELRATMDGTTAPKIIIDLTEVASIDSVAVGVLVHAFVTCHKTNRRLALVGLSHRVRNVLQLTGIDPLFETFPTLADAERALA